MPGLSRKYLCSAYGTYALINNIDVEQKEHAFWLQLALWSDRFTHSTIMIVGVFLKL